MGLSGGLLSRGAREAARPADRKMLDEIPNFFSGTALPKPLYMRGLVPRPVDAWQHVAACMTKHETSKLAWGAPLREKSLNATGSQNIFSEFSPNGPFPLPFN